MHGLVAHPSLTRFAVTGRAGLLQLWDYAEKRLLLMRMFDKLLGHTLAFSPNGKFLAIGFTNGRVRAARAPLAAPPPRAPRPPLAPPHRPLLRRPTAAPPPPHRRPG